MEKRTLSWWPLNLRELTGCYCFKGTSRPDEGWIDSICVCSLSLPFTLVFFLTLTVLLTLCPVRCLFGNRIIHLLADTFLKDTRALGSQRLTGEKPTQSMSSNFKHQAFRSSLFFYFPCDPFDSSELVLTIHFRISDKWNASVGTRLFYNVRAWGLINILTATWDLKQLDELTEDFPTAGVLRFS